MYTKGPWKVSSYQDGVTCVRDSNDQVLCRLVIGNDDNATLMAAGPEMLKALKSVQKYIEGDAWDGTDISAVILKACPDAEW